MALPQSSFRALEGEFSCHRRGRQRCW